MNSSNKLNICASNSASSQSPKPLAPIVGRNRNRRTKTINEV